MAFQTFKSFRAWYFLAHPQPSAETASHKMIHVKCFQLLSYFDSTQDPESLIQKHMHSKI